MTSDRIPDDTILAEAREERTHQEQLARIQADRDVGLARERRLATESRHVLLGWAGGVTAVLLVIGGITGAVIWNVNDDRNRDERFERDATVAELCVHRGDIWLDGSCVPAKREDGGR